MADIDDNGPVWWSKGRGGRVKTDSPNLLLGKYLPKIAQSISSIKVSLLSLVKAQEGDRKQQYFERQRQRASDFTKKYKKIKPTKEDKKAISSDKNSFFDIIKDGLSNIFKFALLGLAAIGTSKLLSLPGVMDGIKSFIKEFIISVSDIIKKGVSFLTDLIKDTEITNSLVGLFKKIFTFIGEGISKVSDVIKNILSDPENKQSLVKIITSVIGTVFTGLLSALDIVGNLLSSNQDSIKNGIVSIFVKISEGIAGALKFTTSLLDDPEFRKSLSTIYYAIKNFINTILEEPIFTIAGQPVNLKMAFIAVGTALVAFEAGLAYFTGMVIGKSVGGVLGRGPGKGGGAPTGGAPTKGGKLGKIFNPTNAVIAAGTLIGAKEFYDATKSANKKEAERNSTSPTKMATGPATMEQKTLAVGQAKGFAGKSAADFISSMEGFAGKAYLDPPGNNKEQYSIGHGHLIQPHEIKQGFINLGDGKKIAVKGVGGKDTVITKEEAKQLLATDVPKYEKQVADSLGSDAFAKLNQDQKNALTSLAYNSGKSGIDYLVKNGLRDAILKGDMENASRIIYEKGYKTAQGQYLSGLDTRRLKEATLFAGAGSEAPTQMANSATNEIAKTPQTPTAAPAPKTENPIQKKPSFNDTLASLLQESTDNDFFRKLDEMSGGKLGLASNDLASIIRTRGLVEAVPDVLNGSTEVSSSSSTQTDGPLPSIFDETLLKKLSLA